MSDVESLADIATHKADNVVYEPLSGLDSLYVSVMDGGVRGAHGTPHIHREVPTGTALHHYADLGAREVDGDE